MPIKVPCTCGARLNVNDSLAGKRVRCPHCKSVHQVPDASAFAPVPGSKPAAQDEAPAPKPAEDPRKGISLKGKGDAAKHSGRLSEPTMVMSTEELKQIIEGKAPEEPAPPEPEPEPELPAPEPAAEPAPAFEEMETDPPAAPERETRVRRAEAKEHLKKIQQELKEQKDEAGTRYIPASSGFAKTRQAQPTMVITKDKLRELQEAEEVGDDAPPSEPPAEAAEPAPPPEEPAPQEPPPSAVELPAEKPRPKSDVKPAVKPRSEVKPPEPAAACGHSGVMLLVIALFCFISAAVGLLGILGVLGRFGSWLGYVTLTLTGIAGILAFAQAARK